MDEFSDLLPQQAGNGGSCPLRQEASSSCFIGLPSEGGLSQLEDSLRARKRLRRLMLDDAQRVAEEIRRNGGRSCLRELEELASLVLGACTITDVLRQFFHFQPSRVSKVEVSIYAVLLQMYDQDFETYQHLIEEVYPEALAPKTRRDYRVYLLEAERLIQSGDADPKDILSNVLEAFRITTVFSLVELETLFEVRELRERVLAWIREHEQEFFLRWEKQFALTWNQ